MLITIKNNQYNIKAVVFDKDGTLLDNQYFWPRLLNARMKALADKGLSEEMIKECRLILGQSTSGMIDPDGPLALASKADEIIVTATALYKMGYKWDSAVKFVEEAFKAAEENLDVGTISKVYDGVKETLTHLKSKGIVLGVATSDDIENSLAMLNSVGILSYFDVVVGRNMVKYGKPKPDMIKFVSYKTDIPCREIIVVGDALADIQMAINAGAVGIGVLTGIGRKGILETIAVDVLDSTVDIVKFFNEFSLTII